MTFTTAAADAGTFRVELGLWSAGCAAQGWFATGMMGDAFCNRPQQLFPHVGWDIWPASQTIGAGAAGQWQINAPPGITITAGGDPEHSEFRARLTQLPRLAGRRLLVRRHQRVGTRHHQR